MRHWRVWALLHAGVVSLPELMLYWEGRPAAQVLTLREGESLPTSIPMMTGSHPALRTALFVAGAVLVIVTPLVALLPGPGGVFTFAGGLALMLRNSAWAKRVFTRFKRKWPRVGGWADWGLCRASAERRRKRDRAILQDEPVN